MQRSWRTLIPIAVLIVLIGYLYAQRNRPALPAAAAPAPASVSGATPSTLPAFLPSQAKQTISLIKAGGPFAHRQDGGVFSNHEHLLPAEPRGYYHEYTVETPGAHDRGARRIITGGDPPVVWYYTSDHYRSFRKFEVP